MEHCGRADMFLSGLHKRQRLARTSSARRQRAGKLIDWIVLQRYKLACGSGTVFKSAAPVRPVALGLYAYDISKRRISSLYLVLGVVEQQAVGDRWRRCCPVPSAMAVLVVRQ